MEEKMVSSSWVLTKARGLALETSLILSSNSSSTEGR